ncbi:MAG: phosphatase PAP2 family protein, partial [Nitrospira sp.]
HRVPAVTELMYLVTILFDMSWPFFIISFLVGLLIYVVRDLKYTILFLSSLLAGGVFIFVLKYFFDVSRPLGGLVDVFGKSFPSGHTTISTIFFIMLMYVFDEYFSGVYKKLFNIFCIASIFLVGLSRLYLGVHWFSDVVGGLALGLFISYISISLFRYRNHVHHPTAMVK